MTFCSSSCDLLSFYISYPPEKWPARHIWGKNDHHPSLQYVFGMWGSSSVHCDVCRRCVKHCVWDILHRSNRMQRSHNWRTCTSVNIGQYKCTGSSDPHRLIGSFSCKSLNKLFGVSAKTEVVCRSNTHTQNHWRGAGLWHISHPPAKRICGSRRLQTVSREKEDEEGKCGEEKREKNVLERGRMCRKVWGGFKIELGFLQ